MREKKHDKIYKEKQTELAETAPGKGDLKTLHNITNH